MSLEVRWTEEAEYTFDHIVALIQNGWGSQPANKFREKTQNVLNSISHQPLMFPKSGIDNVRKAVITRQTSVYYEVFPDYVFLVFFWDNRQDPLIFS